MFPHLMDTDAVVLWPIDLCYLYQLIKFDSIV